MEILFTARAFGALLVVVEIAFLAHHRTARRRLTASALWPSVEGEITESDVERRGRKGRATSYAPRVRYRYEIGDHVHTRRAPRLAGEVAGSRTRAERRLETYPVGARVRVHYDPGDPSVTCLERTHEGGAFERVGGILGLALGGALLLGLLPPN